MSQTQQPDTGLKAMIIPVTAFEQNCTLLWCTKTMRGAAVDPGGDLQRILDAAGEHNVTLEKVLVTHAHIDHAGAVAELAEQKNIPIEGPHPDDQFLIDSLDEQGARFGLGSARAFVPTRWLKDGDQVTVGDLTFDVIHCPGHTPGHVVFFHAASKLAIVGDVLFRGSIGRTDFPRGNHQQLIDSIQNGLWPLGEDVAFVPGHGPMSTFGQERRLNPFVADTVLNP